MRILHVTSDWKWTGPAEPMLQLALAQRAAGHDVELACPAPPDPERRSIYGEAVASGLTPSVRLAPGRGVRALADHVEVRRLRAHLRASAGELVHTWHTRDHVLTLRAVGWRARTFTVIRSYRNADTLRATPWNRWLFGAGTDGLLCVSPATAERNRALRGGRPVAGAFGAVDLGRFQPAPAKPEARQALGLEPGHRVVGIVARVQPHRRFDLLLDAAVRLFRADPQARLLVIGRGTHRAELAEGPAHRLGIADRVVFAGYRHEDYATVLRAIDVFTFLVPGSDGTCRALLEAAACGIPAVTSRRGALPEIVEDGHTGLLVDEDAEALAAAWGGLLADGEQRARLGRTAAARARERFAPERLATTVHDLYEQARRR